MSETPIELFYSYAPEDESLCQELDKHLALLKREKKITPWSRAQIIPGDNRMQEIEKHLNTAQIILLLVSPDFLASDYCYSVELQRAIERHQVGAAHVVPIILRPCNWQRTPFAALQPLTMNGIPVTSWPDPDAAFYEIELGIRRVVEELPSRSHILVASLGDSPIVIPAMYDLLTKREGLAINEVIVLHPAGEDIGRGYGLVKDVFANKKCKIRPELLPFEDANNTMNAGLYLKTLYTLLDTFKNDTVYLSLAGGRKSMAALTAWVAPFFSCVKGLYHVIDPDEEHLLSIDALENNLTPSQRKAAMHPDLTSLRLVDIPFEPGQLINQELIAQLRSATNDELEKMSYLEAEKAIFVQDITQGGILLEVRVTKHVREQFDKLCLQDRNAARCVRECLERMHYTSELDGGQADSFRYKSRSAKSRPVDLHVFKSFGTTVRPIFYTRPKDISTSSLDEIEQVIICELDTGENGSYRSLQEITEAPDFSVMPAYALDELPPVSPTVITDSVLIVPLGTSPMVATQLYTLLTAQEGRNIHEVILLFPALATEIRTGADIIRKSLQEEKQVQCTPAHLPRLEDIDSSDACRSYQTKLETVIDQARANHPGCEIDLALSGGRKGMTAMTIFAAQRKHLPYVYHTLITDDTLNQEIEEQTTIGELNDLSKEERNDRLFLRAYEGDGPYTRFALFKVPVLPATDHSNA